MSNPPQNSRAESNLAGSVYTTDPVQTVGGGIVYDTGISTGYNQPEARGMPGHRVASTVVWKDGVTKVVLDPTVFAEVNRRIGQAARDGVVSPAEEAQLNYTIDDVMDNGRLDRSAPAPRSSGPRR